MNPFGLITYFDGPHLGRGTDKTAFRDSNILIKFRLAVQEQGLDPDHYSNFGDRIFVNRPPSFLSLPLVRPHGPPRAFEGIESVCRTSVEWAIGKVVENWKSLTFERQSIVGLTPIARNTIVAVILTNALTILNGSQVHSFFSLHDENPYGLEIVSLEDYFL